MLIGPVLRTGTLEATFPMSMPINTGFNSGPMDGCLWPTTAGAFLFDPASHTAEDRSKGLAISQTYRLDADPLAMDRFIAGTQDNGTYLKHDGQWEHVLGGDGFQCAFHSELQDVIYASLYYGSDLSF